MKIVRAILIFVILLTACSQIEHATLTPVQLREGLFITYNDTAMMNAMNFVIYGKSYDVPNIQYIKLLDDTIAFAAPEVVKKLDTLDRLNNLIPEKDYIAQKLNRGGEYIDYKLRGDSIFFRNKASDRFTKFGKINKDRSLNLMISIEGGEPVKAEKYTFVTFK